MIALVFPFRTEMEAFLAGLAPSEAPPASAAPPSAGPLALKSLRSRLPLREESLGGFRAWRLDSHPAWRLVVSGQGKVEAALACQTIQHALAPSAYLLLGSASALDPALRPGDLVLADPGLEADFQPGAPPPRFPARQPLPPIARQSFPLAARQPLQHASEAEDAKVAPQPRVLAGALLSADRNIFDPDEKRAMFAAHHALAYAWEGAGFHRFLRRNQAHGWELRLITETAAEGRLPLTTLQARMAQGFPAVYPILEALETSLPGIP